LQSRVTVGKELRTRQPGNGQGARESARSSEARKGWIMELRNKEPGSQQGAMELGNQQGVSKVPGKQ